MAPKRSCSEMDEDDNGDMSIGPAMKRRQPTEAEIAFVVKAKLALLGLAVQKEALRRQFGDEHSELGDIDKKMEEYRETLREKKILGCDFTAGQEDYIRVTGQRRAGR